MGFYFFGHIILKENLKCLIFSVFFLLFLWIADCFVAVAPCVIVSDVSVL